MADGRPRLVPDESHPITMAPAAATVRVHAGSTVVADTERALELREASYAPVFYVPIEDVDRRVLRDSELHTYCPYKGDASYYGIVTEDLEVDNAVWTYREPYDAVAVIADHVAFYPHRVTVEVRPR